MNFKAFVAAHINIFHYFYINLVRLFNLTDLYQPTYNPSCRFLIRSSFNQRNCDDRILSIKENVDLSRIGFYMDIGSQLGYFVFRLCELNKSTIGCGIERDSIACNYANSLVALNHVKNVSFINCRLNESSVKTLPTCDMISLLNVFHHIVYFNGFDAANSIMQQLYHKCNLYFIFETGQFNEKVQPWSNSLDFMGDNPEKWIQEYLIGLGYKDVRLAGRFATHVGSIKRAFFICFK